MFNLNFRNVVTFLTLYIVMWGFLVAEKPVHIDEANFLALTTGNWFEPHNIKINWQGQTQVAFDVLSNPPGIAWWLWPVRDLPIWIMRMWMLPWAFLGLWGALEIGRYYGKGAWPAVVLLSCPIFVLSIGGLMPDMPVLGCLLLGWAGYVRTKNRFFLVVMGMGCIFRYNALFFCTLFLFFNSENNKLDNGFIWRTLFIFSPILTLFVIEVFSYGTVHFFHMIFFQSENMSILDRALQLPSLLSMLIGGAIVPVLVTVMEQKLIHWLAGLLVGVLVLLLNPLPFLAAAWNFLWIVLGVTFTLGIFQFGSSPLRRWSLWCLGGIVFMMGLRFSATRYWMPFVFIFIMMFVFQTSLVKIKYGSILSLIITTFLFIDDYKLAEAQHASIKWADSRSEKGAISGHWGFQYYAEKSGWVSAEDDKHLPDDIDFWLVSSIAWPQDPLIDCFKPIDVFEVPVYSSFLPHVHRFDSRSNFHASAVFGSPPSRSFAPWGFGGEPYERVVLYQRCTE